MTARLRMAAMTALLLFGMGVAAFGQDKQGITVDPPDAAHLDHGLLLPEGITEASGQIDALFWLIMGITGVVFVLTEGCLIYFIVKYRTREGRKAHYTHGNHKVEMIWTLIPAAILAIIAVVQVGPWTAQKATFPDDDDPLEVHILAKQFEWYFRYPGPDERFGTDDDYVTGRLTIPAGRTIIFKLRSLDVIHSFYLPHARLKQDALPGTTQSGWFRVREENAGRSFPILCAELCGSGHHTMGSVLEVLSPEDFKKNEKQLVEDFGVSYPDQDTMFRYWPVSDEG